MSRLAADQHGEQGQTSQKVGRIPYFLQVALAAAEAQNSMESGPTQGAERHSAAIEHSWTSHPWLARLLRVSIFAVPLAVSFAFSISAGRIAPADELGMNRWLWIGVVFLLANILLLVLRSLTSRLIPLVALMKMTLVFPDNAPSRTKAALRKSNSRTMLRDMRAAQERGDTSGEALHGDYLVQLLQEVNDHDRMTRGHSERVRAYSELLGAELGLDEDEMHKLRWAALLHDVGKLTVPFEILNSSGRPNDEEWKLLSAHPSEGLPLLEPLRPWLGDWIHAADQHHCRWDGTGYPSDLAGTDITVAGRLVAIADAYDVMTSARSYKQPLAPEVARQELTDCAGAQFDPQMVRAFLRVGLGRLKTVAGPLAWLANLGGSAQLPIPAASAVSTGVWSAGIAATGLVTLAVNGGISIPQEEPLALEVPVIAQNVEVEALAGEGIEVVLTADGQALVFSVGGAAQGNVTFSGFPELVGVGFGGNETQRWQVVVTYVPDGSYTGEDGFSFEACDEDGNCDQGAVTVNLAEPPPPPPSTTEATTTTTAPTTTAAPTTAPSTAAPTTAAPTTTTTAPPQINFGPTAVDDIVDVAEDGSVLVAVLANDTDPESDALSVTGIGAPLHGAVTIDGTGVRYTPNPDYVGTDQFSYTVSDGANPSVVGTVEVNILPANDSPLLVVPDATVLESVSIGSTIVSAVVSDVDDTTFTYALTGDVTGRFSISASGVVTLVAPLDYENTLLYNLSISVSDGEATTTEGFQVNVTDVDETPVVGDDVAAATEDTAIAIAIGANDADPEGAALSWIVPAVSVEGGTLLEVAGIVTYTPPADFLGPDSFVYEVEDPGGNRSVPATVTLTVAAVNDAPVAVGDGGVGFLTTEDVGFTTVNVTVNDSDVDDVVDGSSVVVTSGVSSGVLTNNGDGTFGYVPALNSFGSDSFSYTITDDGGATSAAATVTLTVAAVNDAPVAVGDTLTVPHDGSATTIDLRLNDTDPENDPLTIIAISNGTSGTVVDNGDGTVTYTHDGSASTSDTFSYTVEDSSGLPDIGSVAVTISPPIDFDGVVVGDNCPSTYNPDQADTDGDGLGDVCDTTPTAASSADFTGVGIPLTTDNSVGVAAADFDGDGDRDVVFANNGQQNRVFRNFAGLLVSTGQNLGAQNTKGVAVGDMDGDGTPDLVFANDGVGNRVWLNDGSANFTATGQSIGSSITWAVAVGDLDADGDMDAVFANIGQANTLWLNDGSGTLVDSGQNLGSGPTKGIAVGDLNGDTFLDLAFSNDGASDTVWFNNGAGVFSNSGQALGIGRSHASVLSDLDRDGDLDIAIAGDNEGDTVWLNNGTGVFTDSGLRIGLGHSRAVAAGDLDGDGDLDLAFGDHFGANTVWLNNGSAVFSDSGNRIGSAATEGIAMADLDGDGDVGLIFANNVDTNRAYGAS